MAKVSTANEPLELEEENKLEAPKKWELKGDELHVYFPSKTIVLEELNGLQSIAADKQTEGATMTIGTCRAIFAIRKVGDRKYEMMKNQVVFNHIAQSLKARELDRCVEAYFTEFFDSNPEEVKKSV